jgi:ribonuclease BN (tRNA processing enzyme)
MSDLAVHVTNVSIPVMSTIGYAIGYDDAGRMVTFVGDHRPMRDIGYALENGEDVTVLVPAYAIQNIVSTRDEPPES